ncbi:MAG: nucleoside hydrolase [Bdellovibrionales bacterium]
MRQKIIVDGDGGGDEAQLMAVLLARPEKFEVLGATAVHGNTHHDQVVENFGSILRMFRLDRRIPYFPGAKTELGKEHTLEGDGAHGDNGLGRATPEKARYPSKKQQTADFILQTLRDNPPGTVTITATGPLSNIAQALHDDPKTLAKAKEIVIMGGCIRQMPAHDMDFRQGNIHPKTEFNFHMAAADAKAVMQSGIAPMTLFPLDCTQQMEFTPKRELWMRRALRGANPDVVEDLVKMMKAPEWLDKMKFNKHAFMHDIHTAMYLEEGELYRGRFQEVTINDGQVKETRGMSTGSYRLGAMNPANTKHNVLVMEDILDPDRVFSKLIDSYKRLLLPKVPLYPTPDFVH